MYGMLFQVIVRGAILVDDQIINRDVYLARLERKREAYRNMSEHEKDMHNIRVAMKGCHT